MKQITLTTLFLSFMVYGVIVGFVSTTFYALGTGVAYALYAKNTGNNN